MSKFELHEKTAIVTGGAGGIGLHIAKTYAEAGANVVVASRNLENLNKVVADIEAEGGTAFAVAVDITAPEQVDNMIAQTVDKFGRVDVIVTCAGRWGASHKAEETPIDEWNRVVDLNLTGAFLSCIAAGKQMIEQGAGKIINVSSTAGSKGNPGQLHYSAAKAGVLSLTNNLAFMWAKHNINVLHSARPDRHRRAQGLQHHPFREKRRRIRRPSPRATSHAGECRRPRPLSCLTGLGPDHRRADPDPCLVQERPLLATVS